MSDVLRNIAVQLSEAEKNVAKAKTLINFMDNAGNNTAQHKLQLQQAEAQLIKYKDALKKEGIEIPT